MTRNDLITNRTSADIDLALSLINQNLPLPPDNLKIAWDWRALQRVEEFTVYLADMLRLVGYPAQVNTKTDWNYTDTNSEAEGNRILDNLRMLRAQFPGTAFMPPAPDSPNKLTASQANDIEKILFYVDWLIEMMRKIYPRAGNMVFGGSYFYFVTGDGGTV